MFCSYQYLFYLCIEQLKQKYMKLRIIGYTDTVNECDCCGKTELKGTFVMADELDNEMYFGRVCGAKHAGWSASEFSENLKKFNSEEKKQKALNEMIAEAGKNTYKQQNILKFIRKNAMNLNEFLKKHATIIDEINDFVVFKYGNECINIVI
jgi:hypothetical protein